LIDGFKAADGKTMLRFGQALLAPHPPDPRKTFSATLNPETPAIREATEEVAARAVKPIVAKRSQDGAFSVEEGHLREQYARDLGNGSLQRAHLKTINQRN
jgi:hypothetical protein